MNLVAVVCSAIVWVVVSGDPEVESLRREVESLKNVVVTLQDVCGLHSSEIKSLQKTAEDQQKTIEKQQVLIEKLLSENQDLKNKSQNWSFKRTGLVNQKSENVGEHDIYENSRVIRGYQESSHEGLLAEDQRNKRLLSQTTPGSPVQNAVAFYAYMSTSVSYTNNHHVPVFDTVKTNIGDSFHHSTGVFMVPSSGDDVYLRTRNGGGMPDGNLPMTCNPWGRTSFSGWKIN
uniref:C1q domain-containing protein n=1 Tax=Magallana gigas TaxID=29159 RepID=A0A8W8NDF0_MAGGI